MMRQVKPAMMIIWKVRAIVWDLIERRVYVELILVRVVNIDECD